MRFLSDVFLQVIDGEKESRLEFFVPACLGKSGNDVSECAHGCIDIGFKLIALFVAADYFAVGTEKNYARNP